MEENKVKSLLEKSETIFRFQAKYTVCLYNVKSYEHQQFWALGFGFRHKKIKMRIITGDECGVLKETIPELSRCDETKNDSYLGVEDGVMRIGGLGSMKRSRAVVDLAFCDRYLDDATGSGFNFCALRFDGSLERWGANAPNKSKEDRICGGSYEMLESLNLFEKRNNENIRTNIGRPIAMCSAMRYPNDRKASIITCCTSGGELFVVDLERMDSGITAKYDIYSKTGSTLSYTKGSFLNRDIVSSLAMGHCGKRVAVGGRERAATILDLETGKQLWKVRHSNVAPNISARSILIVNLL